VAWEKRATGEEGGVTTVRKVKKENEHALLSSGKLANRNHHTKVMGRRGTAVFFFPQEKRGHIGDGQRDETGRKREGSGQGCWNRAFPFPEGLDHGDRRGIEVIKSVMQGARGQSGPATCTGRGLGFSSAFFARIVGDAGTKNNLPKSGKSGSTQTREFCGGDLFFAVVKIITRRQRGGC